MRMAKEISSLTVLALWLSMCSHASAADEVPLTNEAFFDLQKRMLSLTELEWKERVANAEAWQKERQDVRKNVESTGARHRSTREGERVVASKMQANLESTSARYRSHRATLLTNFQTSDIAFTRHARENREALEQYLTENPAAGSGIDSIKSRVDGLIQRFESLMAQSREGEPK